MTSDQQFIPSGYSNTADNGSFCWSAPSNIALIKYWGKKDSGPQLPANPSLSFTLSECKTITNLSFDKKNTGEFSFDLLFEGKSKQDFKPKIAKFFERVGPYLPFLDEYHFTIDTRNTFPHSSGIASSASGMAALAMNLMSIERQLNPQISDEYFYQKASFLARLGSGSACRSINGRAVVWGASAIKGSSDLFGVEFPGPIHENFLNYQDTILLIDKGEKKVSSTVGHNLMNNHPFAQQRFDQAHYNLSDLSKVLQNGDLERFVAIVESEALTLHSMMMTSMPYFILMKPNTLEVINRIWNFRNETKTPVCFTLDAGANVHVLYPNAYKNQVMAFIENELKAFCQDGEFICDETGNGAQMIAD